MGPADRPGAGRGVHAQGDLPRARGPHAPPFLAAGADHGDRAGTGRRAVRSGRSGRGAAGLGTGGSGAGAGSPSALVAPNGAENPVGQAGLTAFQAECFGGQGPKLDFSYVWDPAAQNYHGVAGDVVTSFYPSPDGKKA